MEGAPKSLVTVCMSVHDHQLSFFLIERVIWTLRMNETGKIKVMLLAGAGDVRVLVIQGISRKKKDCLPALCASLSNQFSNQNQATN